MSVVEKKVRYLKYHMPLPLRKIVNSLYYNPDVCMVQRKQIDYVVMNGCKFLPSEELVSLVRPRGPWFEGVRPTDTVLDIGAGIGSVAVLLAKRAKRVYAVEPLFSEELVANVEANGLENVTCWQMALGDEIAVTLRYASKEDTLYPMSLSNIIKVVKESNRADIDFLKVDIEGAEWDIKMHEVEGIRELRIEWHIRRGKVKADNRKLEDWVEFLECQGYLVKLYRNMHEEDIQFKEIVYMVASLGRTEPFPDTLF